MSYQVLLHRYVEGEHESKYWPVYDQPSSGWYSSKQAAEFAYNSRNPIETVINADPTGAVDSSAKFIAAANRLSTDGGTINIPPGTYMVEGLPITVNSGQPIIWVGSGTETTILQLPESPSANMFVAEAIGIFRGGGVVNMSLKGDCSVSEPELPADYDASYDCFDFTPMTSSGFIYQYRVENCYISHFRRAWNSEDVRDRDPIFSNNDWWYNHTAIYVGQEHPIFDGVNDIRHNYIGLAGVLFDMQMYGCRFNYNHYGIKPTTINTCRFKGGTLFKNYKRGILVPDSSTRNYFSDILSVPPDTIAVSSITYSGTVLTVNTSANHRLEDNDEVVLFSVTGLTPDPNNTAYAATVVTDTQFTVDVGSAVSGTASGGRVCTALYDIEIQSPYNTILSTQFRNDGNFNRNGSHSIGITNAYPLGVKVSDCEFFWQGAASAMRQQAIGLDCTQFRDSQITENRSTNISQMVGLISGAIDQSEISNNVSMMDACEGPGSGRDFYELSASAFGNIITSNLVRLNGATPQGRYIFNIDAIRSVVQSNYTRFDASEWSGGINVSGADSVTIGAANGIDHATTLDSNAVSSF